MPEGHPPHARRTEQGSEQSNEPRYDGASEGWAALSTLIGGIAVWGGAGYGLDRLLGTSFLVLVGLLLGMAGSIYLVYVRAGR